MNKVIFTILPLLLVSLTSAQNAGIDHAQINAIYPEVEKLYIDLHQHPELAFQEQRTAAELAKRVKALGYDVTTGIGGTGVVAILKNGTGPTVMLRTELDALPIEEKTGLPFASKAKMKNNSGETVPVGHMCSHDLHMAAWVGTADLMAKNRSAWHGTLMLVAQPAEEIVQGAAAMIKDGLFKRFPKPDYALGWHADGSLPAGVVGFHAGYFRAAVSNLDITVFGKGGHGARPQRAVDPIVVASRIVLALQTIVSRENDPFDPAVITVGSFHGGTVWNIIPDQVKLQLTVRSYKPETHKHLLDAIARVAKGEALAANAPREPLIEVRQETDAVYNDPGLTQRMVAAARGALGPDKVVEMPAHMTSEDFSQFGLSGVKAVLLHIGAVDASKLAESQKSGLPLPDVHSPLWEPAYEPTIKAAITAETTILMDLLKSPAADPLTKNPVNNNSTVDAARDGEMVNKTAAQFIDAFVNLDWERFPNFFAADATAFFPPSARISQRIDGKTEIVKVFEGVFAAARKLKPGPPYLTIEPENSKVQLLGDVALVTFHLKDPGMFGRRTIVFRKFEHKWLIVHLHASGVATQL